MKYLFVILLFISTGAHAQKRDERSVMQASGDLVSALSHKDSVQLEYLLSEDVSYGHSNGWVENKREVINDLFNGRLAYKNSISVFDSIKIHDKVASLRITTRVDVELKGKPIQLDLKVLEVWVWENKHWKLFARQSTKI